MVFKFQRQFIEHLYINRITVVISDITFHILCQLCIADETINNYKEAKRILLRCFFYI